VQFLLVVVQAQSLDVLIGRADPVDALGGKVARQTVLPELVVALDLALGLGRWRVSEGDVIARLPLLAAEKAFC
jgi:hypothetical protein